VAGGGVGGQEKKCIHDTKGFRSYIKEKIVDFNLILYNTVIEIQQNRITHSYE